MSGRQSTSIALLDARGSGIVLSSIHHRDQARVYAKQVARAAASSSCRPRRRRRCASRSAAPADGPRVMRAAYLGPPGTFTEEALLAPAAAGRRARPARRRSHDVVLAVQDGERRARRRADRERARGVGRRDARRARADAPDVAIVGEVVLPDLATRSIARDGAGARRRSRPSCRTRRRSRSARASCARELPRRARDGRGRRPPRRCARPSSARRAVGGDRHAARRRALRRDGAARGRSRTSRATRRASSGSRARRRPRPAAGAAAARRRSCSAGAGDDAPGLARALPVGVRVPRREPDEDRVAAADASASATTCSSSTARARTATSAVAEAVDGLRAHCDEVRVLGLVSGGVRRAAASRLSFGRRPWAPAPHQAQPGFAPPHRAPAART